MAASQKLKLKVSSRSIRKKLISNFLIPAQGDQMSWGKIAQSEAQHSFC
jgi:hypothetical protein